MSAESIKLTDPHDHPEPHTMKWTQAEMDYINNRVETAVRQAIEQAQKNEVRSQEPVAWIDEYGNAFPLSAKKYSVVGKHWKPLYTSSPQRQPLTHEQRFDLLTNFEPHKNKWEAPAILIDMVEAAHGITGEQNGN